MGLRDRFKKVFGQDKKEDEETLQETEFESSDESVFKDIELSSFGNVLFVCSGNADRSPMAEAIFNRKSKFLKAFSAGLNAQNGGVASSNAVAVCANHGIDLSGHRARNVHDFPVEDMDLILALTSPIRDVLKSRYPDLRIFTLKEHAGDADLDISDPFGGDLSGYEECFLDIEDAISRAFDIDVAVDEDSSSVMDETDRDSNGLSGGRLIVVSALEGNLEYYKKYLSLWDENDPDCHIVFLGNLIYSMDADDGSVEILDDAIEKSKMYNNFHYLLGIHELSCIMDENVYKMGIDLKAKFHDLVLRKKGSLEPCLTEYINFFKKLPYFIKTENGLFLSYSGPSKSTDSRYLIHDFLWARQGFGGYDEGDVCEFLDGHGMKFMVVGNRPCDEGYDVFSRQLIISSGPFGENETYLDVDLSKNIDSMDNLVGCLKSVGGIVKASEHPIAVGDEIDEELDVDEISEVEIPFGEDLDDEDVEGVLLKINNFKGLDDLIRSGVRKIVLDSDVVLKGMEEEEYEEHGIEIDVGELLIDGRGHAIDARQKAPLFRISKDANIKIKNITFRNGFSNDGAAIHNEGKLTVIESVFENNKTHVEVDEDMYYILQGIFNNLDILEYVGEGNGGAIYNGGDLTVVKSTFINNFAWSGGAIYSKNKLTVIESVFENNKAYDKINEAYGDDFIALGNGGAISARGSVTDISQSTFTNNFAMYSGAVYNGGELTVSDSTFKKNASEDYGGAIMNDGILNMHDCEISSNTSPQEIVGINKYSQIYNSLFKGNNAETIINNHGSKATFGIFYSKFIENEVKSTIVSNRGRYGVMDSITFQSNLLKDNSRNIINGNELTLMGRMIVEEKSILNEGYILIKNSSQNFEDIIEGEGELVIYENMIPTEDRFDFGHLDRVIHESASKEIVLDHDITFENYEREFYEGGVDLDIDGLVIDGGGKTIDARGKSRFFIITASNITLKNIVFKNGYFYENIMYPLEVGGGALKILQNSNLTIENCKFINNVSEDRCGAIDNAGNVTVIESEFNDNLAKGCAGAIYNKGGMDISKSSLQDNSADNSGGVVYNKGALDIIDSSLQNNAAGSRGGAVYNVGELKFFKSSFANNNSKRKGGVVYNEGMLDIIESSLQNNAADNRGGVVYNIGELKFLESSFANNNSKRKGGVVYNEGVLDIKESKLINNNAHLKGGGIYNENNVTVSGAVFQGNSSRYGGGAVYNDGESDIFKSVFENNSSGNYGGGLYNEGESVVSESVFESNSSALDGGGLYNEGDLTLSSLTFKSNVSGSDGGALFNAGKSNANDVKFIKNSSKKQGGALSNSHELSIDNSEFIENVSESLGGAISSSGNDLTILNSNFNQNNAEKWGGAIFAFIGQLNITKSNFNGNEVRMEGGAIYNLNAALSMKETLFTENSSNESAGAIFNNDGEVDMVDCEIKGNTARVDAGAIVNTAELKISKSSILDNETMGIGGAIVNTANMDISESEISHNSAMHIAGAIDNYNGDLTISKSVFTANEVKWDGGVTVSETVFEDGEWNGSGVIYNDDGKLRVSSSTFADNVIKGRESKAIWSNNLDCEVFDCNFENNQLENIEFGDPVVDVGFEEEVDVEGFDFEEQIDNVPSIGFSDMDDLIHSGAKEIVLDGDVILTEGQEFKYSNGMALDVDDLIIDGRGHTIDARGKSRIFDCTGKNVTIKDIVIKNGFADDGGAIRINPMGELNLVNCKFTDNDSKENGGAISNAGSLTMENTDFSNNNANDGAAISNTGKIKMIEGHFCENKANHGGAIHNSGEIEIHGSEFLKNSAISYGGAIYNKYEAHLEAIDALFKANTIITQHALVSGGAIHNDGECTIEKCSFLDNYIYEGRGPAIWNGRGSTIENECIFENNEVLDKDDDW